MGIVIQSSGLSPSNRNAGFPNLARDNSPSDAEIDSVTAIAKQELETAGITPYVFGFLLSNAGEVPSRAIGQVSLWGFKRAWYYWIATGPGLPVEVAEKLHAEHGRAVRVDGHCGCPSPREWFKGFGCGHYHVDTQEGLNALVQAILSVHNPADDADPSPRTGTPTPAKGERQ